MGLAEQKPDPSKRERKTEGNDTPERDDDSSINRFDFVCKVISSAARQNDLPIAFFTRLIWQESRFDAHAVSPAGARGVAQFMPGTAAYLGLANPFDVTDAVNKSAEYLRNLNKQFGNLGLAAAAYNAGPKRVSNWITAGGSLPAETQAYVRIVTQHDVDDWRLTQPTMWNLLPDSMPCPKLVKLLADKPEQITANKSAIESNVTSSMAAWGLQLTGGPTKATALGAYFEMQKSFRSVLGGHQPLVLTSTAGRGHFWYRVRVAASSLFGAERLCSDLRMAGGACIVQRN